MGPPPGLCALSVLLITGALAADHTCAKFHSDGSKLDECIKTECAAKQLETDECLKAFPHNYTLHLLPCKSELCRCGGGTWDCFASQCSADCTSCACMAKMTPGGSASCQGVATLCEAKAYRLVLNAVGKKCDHVLHCLENTPEYHSCEKATRYASCTDAEKKAICDTETQVHGAFSAAQDTCPDGVGAPTVPTPDDGSHGGHGGHDDHGDHGEPPYNILIMSAMIAIGNFCRHFGSKPPFNILPYTVQVFIFGAAFGFCVKGVGGELLKYGELADMDPHLLFFIFLPILIFESAFATEYHVFKKVVYHCIFLAGPGLMLASMMTATVAYFVFSNYGWSFVACMLFGCMLSATDPVAVVALLKELGAEAAISALIEGESLLNDGTAIVFFSILKDSAAKGVIEKSIGNIIWSLVAVAGGGCLVGYLMGFFTKTALKAVFNDPAIEITLTLVAAYLTFYLAEGVLHVSGVLALVILGMYLAYHSHVISPEVEHSLHHFWEITVYIANTLIFAIAGLTIAERAFEHVDGYDFLYLTINYIALNIIRGVSLSILLVPMNMVGKYYLDWRNSLLCTWGGLRGAVGLALALIIAGDKGISAEHPLLPGRFLFHVAGIVILTLCVNGVTTGKLVSSLKLDTVSDSRKRSMHRAYKRVMKSENNELFDMQRRAVFRDANWIQVRKYCQGEMVDPLNGMHADHNPVLQEPPSVIEDACEHYYRAFAAAIEHEYESGTMLPSSIRVLEAWLSDVQDRAAKGEYTMIDSQLLRLQFDVKWWEKLPCMGGIQGRYMHAFDVGIGFLNCHQLVLEKIDGLCHQVAGANKVKDHCKRSRQECIAILEEFSSQNTDIAMALKSKNAARSILNHARGYVNSCAHKGMIAKNDAALLTAMVEDHMKKLKHGPRSLKSEDTERILVEVCPWYTACQQARSGLRDAYKPYTFEKGTSILKDREGSGCWVVLSGVVRVHIGNKAELFGCGYTAGLLGLLSQKPGKYSEVFAETSVMVAFFAADSIQTQRSLSPVFNAAIWDDCSKVVARKVLACLPQYRDWDHTKIYNFVAGGERMQVIDDPSYPTMLVTDSVNILINGEFKDVLQGRECGTAPCIIPAHLSAAIFTDTPVLFAISNTLSPQEKARRHWAKISNKIFTVRAIAALQGHEAGLKAVREILSGKMTSMFPGAAGHGTTPLTQPSIPPHSNTESAQNQYFPTRTNGGPPSARSNSGWAASFDSPVSKPSTPMADDSSQKPRKSERRKTRPREFPVRVPSTEMTEMSPRSRQSSRSVVPTEDTPWFSQTQRGAQLHAQKDPKGWRRSQQQTEHLSQPLLHDGSRPGSTSPRSFIDEPYDELSLSSF